MSSPGPSLIGAVKTPSHTWQSVRAELQRRISQRIWPPGQLIPTEAELAREFGCARATVSRAMRELADAGQIDRRRKAGTRVVHTPVRRASFEIPIIRLEVESRGAAWSQRILESRTLKPPVLIANRLMLPDGHPALHLRCLHFADRQAFVYEDRWINIEAVPTIASADLQAISANEWLVQQAPFTRGEFNLSAAAASSTEAKLLDVPVGAPLLIIERITFDLAQAITCVRLAYPPGYRINTRI